MLLHAFPAIFVRSLREFPENCVYKHSGLNCFIEYLHRTLLLTANFLSYDIESAKILHLLDLHIKAMNFLFYNYVLTKHFRTNQLFHLLMYMINISLHVIFHIIPFISARSYIIPWANRISHELELKKVMICKISCNNLYISICSLYRLVVIMMAYKINGKAPSNIGSSSCVVRIKCTTGHYDGTYTAVFCMENATYFYVKDDSQQHYISFVS